MHIAEQGGVSFVPVGIEHIAVIDSWLNMRHRNGITNALPSEIMMTEDFLDREDFFIVEINGQAIGLFGLYYDIICEGEEVAIVLFVDHDMRGRGLAEMILSAAVISSLESSKRMVAVTKKNNGAMIRVLEKTRFSFVRRIDSSVMYRF